jgi:outer membrane lipoprotein-sorting protein
MIIRSRMILIACVVLVPRSLALADLAPMDVVRKAMQAQDGVKDYTATVTVDAKIPDVDMPVRSAKVYVKRPDKVFVDSRGLILIPRRALLFGDLAKEIDKETTASFVGKRTDGGVTTYCVKLVPKNKDNAEARNARVLVWVRSDRWTTDKVHVFSGDKLILSVDFSYAKSGGFWMPTKVDCVVKGDFAGEGKQARVTASFKDYQVNTGLTDEFMDRKIAEASRSRQDSGNRHFGPPHRDRRP